jgi:uncharacterized protein
LMCLKGQGVSRDEAAAASWFRKAATQNHAEAQAALGVLCYEGRGVPRDREQALQWLRKAADQGIDSAAKALDQIQKSKP